VQVLPLLKTTLSQIDGTIKPAFSHFSKINHAVDTSKNLEAFGMVFYEVQIFSCLRAKVFACVGLRQRNALLMSCLLGQGALI
jgi:hypothetical protein